MKLHYRGEPFRLDELRAALTGAGAEFLDPTNEWEVLRYRLAGKTGIVYRNAKGRANPTGSAGTHYHNLIAGRPLEMSSGDAKRIARAAGEHRRTLTLYTDASSYHTTGAASWGAILVGLDGAEHEASGPLKGEVSSSTAAEARRGQCPPPLPPRGRVPTPNGWRCQVRPHHESVSHGNTGLATIGCVVPKIRAGPPMTGNPAQARELKPHTQEELIP